MPDIPDLISDEEIALETGLALGGTWELNGVSVPPPSAGCLVLLSLIKSPFVEPEVPVDALAIGKALYVLCNREKALPVIFKAIRAQEALLPLRETAEKEKELYEIYIKAVLKNAVNWSDFDNAVLAFLEEIGPYNHNEVGVKISRYINVSMNGFQMVPKMDAESEGKKKD